MKKKKYYTWLLIAALSFNGYLLSQEQSAAETKLKVLGTIYNLELPFPGVKISVLQDSASSAVFYTDNNGAYSFDLALDHSYVIEVSKTGYYSKFFSIDAKNISKDRRYRQFDNIEADLYMIKDDGILNFINARNGGILQKYFYDASQNTFVYDAEYSMNSMQEMMAFKEVIESVENNPSIKKYFDLYKNQLIETQNKVKEEAYQKKLREQELEQETQKRFYLYGGLLLVVVFSGFMYNRFKVTKKQKQIIEAKELETQEQNTLISRQKYLVEEKQKEILDSINYARRLQQAILPPQEFINTHLPNSFVLYKPKDIVAGDFYWAEHIKDSFFIAAADCTGHGVPGAMVSVICSTALNRSVKEFGLTDPGKILDKTRELVIETFEKSSAEVKDGMDISLLCIDKPSRKIYWSGANNPVWYIQDNALLELKPDKQPVGKAYHASPFTTRQLEYQDNTTFYLFTDGLADQFGGPKGKKFMYKQLKELLFAIKHKSMKEQATLINQMFEKWKGSLEQVDDVCVVGLKI